MNESMKGGREEEEREASMEEMKGGERGKAKGNAGKEKKRHR